MIATTGKTEQDATHGFIDAKLLERASADPARVKLEAKRWRRNPDKYIEENFKRIVNWDFPVFCAANVWITDKRGRRINLMFNRVQRHLWQWFLEDLAAGRPVRWYIVKARQMGISTFFLALFYWLTGLRPNRNALVATHDEGSVQNFNQRFRAIHAESHPMLRSPTLMDRRDNVVFGTKTSERQKGSGIGLDSRVVFATGARGELGRSYNFHMAMLSEWAIWPEVGIDIDSQMGALNQTIPELPGTIIVKETTAKGHNQAKREWDDVENGYRKIFIPHVAFDEYRMPLERSRRIELCGTEEESGLSTRYGNELEEARLIRDALNVWYAEEVAEGGEEWVKAEVDARLNWRRYTINTKCNGDVHTFRREYPTIPAHAFANKGRHVFDSYSLELMRQAVQAEGLKPQRFAYVHNSEITDPNKKFTSDPFGALKVYKQPESGEAYVIGADTSMGVQNGDPSALVVLAVPDLEEVASYTAIVTPDRFAELLFYLGLIYNTALLGVEDNERGGYAVNLKLAREMHYPRLYYRFDPYDKKAAMKPGFVHTDTRKSDNAAKLQKLILDHEILFRTDGTKPPVGITQLQHYTEEMNGTMGAPPGEHDDFVSASLIAVHLSTKVHLFGGKAEVAPRGSFEWAAKRHAERRRPGLLGYR